MGVDFYKAEHMQSVDMTDKESFDCTVAKLLKLGYEFVNREEPIKIFWNHGVTRYVTNMILYLDEFGRDLHGSQHAH